MIKSKLIERIHAQNTHLYLRDVEKAVGAMLGEIAASNGGNPMSLNYGPRLHHC